MYVPIEAWEDEFPAIDFCLKETIRIQMSGNTFRWNMSGRDITLGDECAEVIPRGAFATLTTADIHYHPAIYTNPDEWDPDRYLPGREEDKKQSYAWMGRGVAAIHVNEFVLRSSGTA